MTFVDLMTAVGREARPRCSLPTSQPNAFVKTRSSTGATITSRRNSIGTIRQFEGGIRRERSVNAYRAGIARVRDTHLSAPWRASEGKASV
jgi:hypothetical protein